MEIELDRVDPIKRFTLKNSLSLLVAVNNLVFLFFLLMGSSKESGVYQHAVVGALFELLWIPVLAVLFCSPIFCLYFMYKERFRFSRLWLLLGVTLISIVLLFTAF
ncbi:hypothetical protein [Flavobacterium sp. NKUCC04_CG]|uniref:hypothetical protein n=1 Tax=Flavobacterium sp. NKUCC04_CG TaxID=2842121 RepID=UPI001C5B6858|nr:hypothetical protein [Flavobacterium sp. NKUCC04_CG]MBW3519361.1 hypothetical protein [Flavobacterium sp. NKUCC04_CG]